MGRRTAGEGSLFDSPKGSGIWYAQVTLPNGTQRKRKGPSLKEAKAKLKELQRLVEGRVDLSAKQPTLAEWCRIYLAEYTPNLRANIREDYRGIFRRYVDDATLGKTRLKDLTHAAIQGWVNDLSRRGLSPSTVRNAFGRVKKALAVAKRQGYLASNPAVDVALPSRTGGDIEAEDREIHPYSFAQSIALLQTVEGNRWAALYELAVTLGLRQAELLGLTWDCVDLARGTLTIKQQLRRVRPEGQTTGPKEWRLLPPKTPRAKRTLTLSAELIAALRAHRKNLLEERLLHGADWQARDPFKSRGGLLFVTEEGAPIHASNLVQHFHRRARWAELPQIRFHDLRHTAATLMLADGVQMVAVSTILGHANPGITMKIYAHALEDATADAVAGLSKRLRRG